MNEVMINRLPGESYEAFGERASDIMASLPVGDDTRGERVYLKDEITHNGSRRTVTLIIELDITKQVA